MLIILLSLLTLTGTAFAATSIPFTIHTSETVNVTGTPRIAVDVGGVTRYASYTSGSGTNALTFTYAMVAGDVDLDGVALSSPIDLNGGTIKDLNGNDASLTFTVPNTSNVKVNYPSLGMDFVADADGRYTLNGTVYNDLTSFLTAAGGTFTRASTATYFDSTGTLQTAASGVPRFDYDPVTHAAKGVLIEESRTNLLNRSSEFENAAWTSTNVAVTPNSTSAPDGSNTADLITANVIAVNNGMIYKGVTGSFSTYTFSIYAKAGNVSHLRIQIPSLIDSTITGYVANFDLSSATSAAGGQYGGKFTNLSSSISSVGNGWYRCVTTFTVSGTTWNDNLNVWVIPYYSGDSVGSNVYTWGAQLEQGSFPTSYIPTTIAAATRAADVLSVPATIGSTGTWASTFQTSSSSSQVSIFGTSPGSQSVPKLTKTGQVVQITRPLIGPILNRNLSPAASDSVIKAAMSYDTTSSNITGNGLSVATGGSGGTGTATSVKVGVAEDGVNEFINGYIQKLRYYPSHIAATQLQLLTQ